MLLRHSEREGTTLWTFQFLYKVNFIFPVYSKFLTNTKA
jgi:hypothetical protein